MKKLSDVVNNNVFQNRKFNTLKRKVNNLENKVLDATTLTHINQCNTDKPSLQNTTGDVDQKMPDTSGLVTTTILNKKLVKLRIKFLIMIKILLLKNLIILKKILVKD